MVNSLVNVSVECLHIKNEVIAYPNVCRAWKAPARLRSVHFRSATTDRNILPHVLTEDHGSLHSAKGL